jgi:hypothetical protein
MLGFYGIKICHYSIPVRGICICSSVVSILKHTRPRYTTYFSRNLQPAYLESYCRVTPLVCFRMPCIATRHDRVDTLPSDFSLCVIATDFILLSAHSIHFTLYSGSRCLFTLLIILPYTVYDKPLHVVTC